MKLLFEVVTVRLETSGRLSLKATNKHQPLQNLYSVLGLLLFFTFFFSMSGSIW